MILLRPARERGLTELGWLLSRHTFSFGEYQDSRYMGYRTLRVINDDRVGPGAGFGAHPHRDMEILSYVLEGAMEHEDSLGTGSVIRPGELQRMTAGTGITHSEFNASATEPLHFLQIWVLPEKRGLEPGYEQRAFPLDEKRGELVLVASRDGHEDSLTVHQDLRVYAGRLAAGDAAGHRILPARHVWVQAARGAVSVDDVSLEEGDGAAVNEEAHVEIRALTDAEVLLFDLA